MKTETKPVPVDLKDGGVICPRCQVKHQLATTAPWIPFVIECGWCSTVISVNRG
jgi:hypothetical protein